MSKYIGDFADNAIVPLGAFTTNAADGGRESFSAGLEEADITIYSDDGDGTYTAMTLSASTIVITENPESQVGVYLVAVDMSNDTDFTTGKDYVAVLYPDTETVDSQSVAAVLGHWSCENRTVDVGKISGDSTAADNLEADYDGTGYNKSNSTIGTCASNDDMRGTDSASTHSAADVWSVTTRDLTALPAGFITASSIAASALDGKGDWNTTTPLTAGGIRTAVGLASANLDTQLTAISTFAENADQSSTSNTTLIGTVDTVVDAIKVQTDKMQFTVGDDLHVSVQEMASGVITAASIAASALDGKGDWNTDKTGYSLSTAGLAAFVTTDTGESTASNGSVAKISQGSAGGNVTVGSMTPAALAQFVTDDTGETTATSGSVSQISQGSGGGGGDATLANQTTIISKLNASDITTLGPPISGTNLKLVKNKNYEASNDNALVIPLSGFGTQLASCDDVRITVKDPKSGTKHLDRVASTSVDSANENATFDIPASSLNYDESGIYELLVEIRHGTEYAAAIVGEHTLVMDIAE